MKRLTKGVAIRLFSFGTADQPRDQQIAAGIEYFTKLREHQRQIKQAIEELEQANSKR
jgi:hypothetical protein